MSHSNRNTAISSTQYEFTKLIKGSNKTKHTSYLSIAANKSQSQMIGIELNTPKL